MALIIAHEIFIPLSSAMGKAWKNHRRNKRRARDRIHPRRDDTFSFVARSPRVDIRGRSSRIKNRPGVCSHGYCKRKRDRRKGRRGGIIELDRAMHPVSRGAVVNDGLQVKGRRKREAGRSLGIVANFTDPRRKSR